MTGNLAGGILTDLSKAFDCLDHDLLIAKLEAYGFEKSALTFLYSYLSERRQRTKVNNFVSDWLYILLGVPQGSILGPILFNIFMNDIFYFVQNKCLANYADDNTPHTTGCDIATILHTLENETDILLKWFNINYFKMNADKCKLLVTKNSDNVSVQIDGHYIKGSINVKLLGVKIDNTLSFNDHVSSIYKKGSQKLHAIARVSPYLSTQKLRVLLKAFICRPDGRLDSWPASHFESLNVSRFECLKV